MSGEDGLKREDGEETALRGACRERFGAGSAQGDVAVEELVAFREGTLSTERAEALRAASVEDPALAALLLDARAFPAVPDRGNAHATEIDTEDNDWDAIRSTLAREGLLTAPEDQEDLPSAVSEHVAQVREAARVSLGRHLEAVDSGVAAPPSTIAGNTTSERTGPSPWALAAMVVTALGAGLLLGRLTVSGPTAALAPAVIVPSKIVELEAARKRSGGTATVFEMAVGDTLAIMIEPEPQNGLQNGLQNELQNGNQTDEGATPVGMTVSLVALDPPAGTDRVVFRLDDPPGVAQEGGYGGVIEIVWPNPLPVGRYVLRLETQGELVDAREIVVR